MAYKLKEMVDKKSRLVSGHRMCAGCGAPVVVRNVLKALKDEDNAVIAAATGCLEVSTCIYPYTSWKNCSFIHSAFENAAATISGVETTYKFKKKNGEIPEDKTTKFIAFGGDGGTLDIGFQSLSGAMERGHDFTYVCYDNGAYMNTGTQRSSSTPTFADTTTSPNGKKIPGKQQVRKDLTEIMVKHNIPYVAQTALVDNLRDIYEKSEKAIYTEGPTYMSILAPCPRGWGYNPEDLSIVSKLAVETCFWPLYEIENGKYRITYKPKNKLPVSEFLKMQKRFKHMFLPGNEWMIEQMQQQIDKKWNYLLKQEEFDNQTQSGI